ncbi:MAG: tape measure protein [Lachnospiraceae bacterium]
MGTIRTGIELQDNFSHVLNGIINSVNLSISAMEDMQQTMNADIDTSSLQGARDEINQATIAVNELNDAMNDVVNDRVDNIAPPAIDPGSQEVINRDTPQPLPEPLVENPQFDMPDIQPNAPPVEIPVVWNTDGLDVFTTTGIERFEQEVQSSNAMLEQLSNTQASIEQQASSMDILPDSAIQDISNIGQRLQNVQERILAIESNPMNVGTDQANAELEQLRSQLHQMIQEQNNLNSAMEDMDVTAANESYLRLSSSIGNTERYVRDNVDEQGRFNQEIYDGTQEANQLMNTIKGAVAAYVSIQSIGKVINISDELTQTTARLDLMNDGLQTTKELVNMVYLSAQDARGSFDSMANVVARFGNNAKDAFGSSEEVVAFANLIQKQMTIAGASTTEASNAMIQLSQGLGSGVLRGEELNSIFEQAPNIIQSIADYLEVPIGSIREMASEGELTADIVKAAIFSASDDINSKFEQMPMTWGQVWQGMQNTAIMAFQPVLQRINDIANSDGFQTFVNGAIEAMAVLATIILNIFDLVAASGEFIAANWSIISPLIYGVIAALMVYATYLAIIKGIEIASAVATAIATGAKLLGAAALMIFTGASWAAATAQMGLNSAMYACPIVWIIMLIIAVIAIIYAVCSAIARLTGVANSGFGVITGGINVVIQFFKNLGLTVANIALGIGSAIAAVASNMMTAFHNAICSVQSWFYNLLSTALSVIAGIAESLNKLPFVEFDYSGISSAADDYAAKSAEAAGNKEEYTSISDAFSNGMSTFDTFQDGWASDAFNAGASWGDGIADKVSDFSFGDLIGGVDIPSPDDYSSDFSDASGMGDNLDNISGNTDSMADAMDITSEDLKYLRDIAEQEAVNRYTTADITINQTNNNNLPNGTDLDGVVSGLTDAVNEAVEIVTGKGD